MQFRMFLVMLVVAGEPALPSAAPAPKPKEVGPVEIDFAPLPGVEGMLDYTITVAVETEGGGGLKKTAYDIGAHTSQSTVRDLVKASLPEGWDVETDGSTKLILKSYKTSEVLRVNLTIEGLGKDAPKPVVRRLVRKK